MQDRLRDALTHPLPGDAAHRSMLPRGFRERTLPPGTIPVEAAVLIALRQIGGGCNFPLIVRPPSMARHAGQIGLPGGVVEGGEAAESCALREAREEIGIDSEAIDIVGELTPIEIPVTGYRVESFVGWMTGETAYRPQDDEVMEILLADPDRLLAEGPIRGVEVERGGSRIRFPAYDVEGRAVWGATGLILSEFLEIWRRAREG